MQILYHVIKNRYHSRQVKIQELPPDKTKTQSSINRNKKRKRVKFVRNQEPTRIDMNRYNTLNGIKVWPIIVLVPQLEKRKDH